MDEEFLSEFRLRFKETRAKMLEQSISCSQNPAKLLRNHVNQSSDELILDLLASVLMAAKQLTTSERISVIQPLLNKLQQHISNRAEIPETVSWFLEHKNLMIPATHEVLLYAKELRANQSCSYNEKALIKSVAFPAEFLYGIHQDIPTDLLCELILIAEEFPRGYMAYKNLEAMGASKSLEWHIDEQKSLPSFEKIVKLHEYAIVTPGAKIDLSIFNYDFSKYVAKLYIELLENTPCIDAESNSKKIAIFDGLITCISRFDMKDVRSLVIDSKIPRDMFSNHPKLLGISFVNDLGL